MSTILDYGISLPRHRVDNSVLHPVQGAKKGKRAVIFSDEDIITLAYAAGTECLDSSCAASGSSPGALGVDAVLFASTTPVFTHKYHASFLADLLALPTGVLAMDFTGSVRSATDALVIADQLLQTPDYRKVLLLAADAHFPAIGKELSTSGREGHAGCALLLGTDGGMASIAACRSYSNSITEEYTYKDKAIQLDARFGREAGFLSGIALALKDFLAREGLKPEEIASVILNSIHARSAAGLFHKAGFDAEKQFFLDRVQAQTGITGVCHPILLLVHALQKQAGTVLFLDYYNGTNAVLLRNPGHAPAADRALDARLSAAASIESYQDYLVLEKYGNAASLQGGRQEIFSSDIMLEREKDNIIHLKGFSCLKCGTVYLMKAQRCNACGNTDLEPRMLSTHGTVFTFTQEHYFPSAFPPVTMAVVDLDGGGRVTLQMTDELHPAQLDESFIGTRVRLVLRKMIENDMKPNYFWKCTRAM